ncbi:HTTM domain-containing protein [Mycolicibacterium sp. lyk4-40-TYG-92]|uniref:HTTM domain-containing protein n=1 Tax=Mycolicibacterium sp. lyk4-40-TYG-92 TaxID=3040295 RepID=UPI00254D22B5|nr:HTTM domain-containing protein [Mycolicibacterium sp. lyk4-40-TYG-92]
MRLADKFDRWVEDGPFTSEDLGIYRIIYALGALLVAPDIAWLSDYPDFMFRPPPGPLQLLSGFPSPATLIGLEVLRSVILIMLGLGIWTKYVSLAAWFILSATYGVTFCLGKVDHTILLTLPPLVLAFANWGNCFSVDALRRRSESAGQAQWPLRLLALLIGWGFFAAGLTKALTGWLSFSSQASRGYFVLGFVTQDRTHWLARWIAEHDVLAAWEVVDWMTVAFELSVLISLPWWRAFRITLAVATIFHLVVLLIMNIDFSHAVVAYGAFVSWGATARRISSSRIGRSGLRVLESRRQLLTGAGGRILLMVLAIAVGAGAWFLMVSPTGTISTGPIGSNLIIVIGALIGLTYLTFEARAAVTEIRRQRAGSAEQPVP